MISLLAAGVMAASVTLGWDASQDAVSYMVYVGVDLDQDPIVWYPTSSTQYTVEGLDFGTTYYFVVTAICADGTESDPSNIVQYLAIPPPTPTPSPTVPPDPTPVPEPTPTPEPTIAPSPTPTPPGRRWGWWKKFQFP